MTARFAASEEPGATELNAAGVFDAGVGFRRRKAQSVADANGEGPGLLLDYSGCGSMTGGEGVRWDCGYQTATIVAAGCLNSSCSRSAGGRD